MVAVRNLIEHLDRYLKIKQVADWPNAFNGLQVENGDRPVKRIAAAVDACEFTLHAAVERGVDFLIVHHGLLWSGAKPLTGAEYRKAKIALDGGLAVYSAHLPLDLHPEVGNNALLCKALGFKKTTPFFFEKGQFIGLQAQQPVDRETLLKRVEKATGAQAKLCPGGPRKALRIGVVTGGAGGEIHKAADEGVDTFITGEGPHWSYTAAEERGLNVIYGGHYATETFGVKALAARISRRFKTPWEFIDHPTGL
jgi:dinuclear metal center YbgI/SA1388 family protein